MKKAFKLFLAVAASVTLFSCSDYLDVTSPSVVDADFVFGSYETGQTVMLGAYNHLINHYNTGTTCDLENIGSDTERCSVGLIAALVGAANLYGGSNGSYEVENFAINTYKAWGDWYKAIAKCNQVIYNIEKMSDFDQIVATAPNDWSDLLGQAYCLRATCYFDLVHWYGDVLYIDEAGKDITDLSSRDLIIEAEMNHVMAIEPYMYAIGENNHLPDRMTRNYADGLIGRLAMLAAGYQTRRTDLEGGDAFYVDVDGNPISFEVWGTDDARNAKYARRTDYKKFYERALPYLKKGVENTGGATLVTSDPRSDSYGRTYGNPFQYVFDQMNKLVMSDESIYEVSMKYNGGGSRVAYNYGRGSNGGSPAYPPKANAQVCTYPEVLYNLFDPLDMRRDASLSVTGSTGGGAEVLYNYNLSNKITIGVGMNKFDPNRGDNPDARQLYSGINYPVMRQSDIILMYAEALAVTGDDAGAKTQLKKIHDRAFANQTEAVKTQKFNELLASCGNNVYDAIIKERSLEFVGEARRRFDLIRTGMMPKVAVEYRAKLVKDIATMKSQGYVQYDNGNQFPAYVWTKQVDAKAIKGYRLTMQCPQGQEEDPILYPSWRGQHDSWETVAEEDGALAKITAGNLTNTAIKGMFRYIDPEGAEAKALEADGYKKTAWGAAQYVNVTTEARWGEEFMVGYTDAMYAAKKAPIYLIPMQSTVCATTGLKNGYGFKSE